MIHGEGLCLTRIQSENASGNRTIGCSVQSDDGYGAPNNTITGEAPVLPEKNRRGTWWVLFFGVAAIFLALGVLPKTGSGRRNPIAAKSSGAISEKNLWTKLTRTFLQHDGEFAGSGELARGDCRHRGGFGWRPRRRVISISSAWSL